MHVPTEHSQCHRQRDSSTTLQACCQCGSRGLMKPQPPEKAGFSSRQSSLGYRHRLIATSNFARSSCSKRLQYYLYLAWKLCAWVLFLSTEVSVCATVADSVRLGSQGTLLESAATQQVLQKVWPTLASDCHSLLVPFFQVRVLASPFMSNKMLLCFLESVLPSRMFINAWRAVFYLVRWPIPLKPGAWGCLWQDPPPLWPNTI